MLPFLVLLPAGVSLIFGIVYVFRLGIERAQRGHGADHHSHGVRIVSESGQ